MTLHSLLMLVLAVGGLAAGCAKPHSGSYEPFWRNRFTTLNRSVTLAREAQQATLREFATAKPAMEACVASKETDEPYRESRRLIARCESRATQSANRVRNVKDNARVILEEWRREAGDYADASLRAQSRQELEDAKARTDRLIVSLEIAEKSMQPVLLALKDDALYLKHRRGVREATPPAYTAPAARDSSFAQMQADITEAAAECDAFIASFPPAGEGTP